MAVIIAGAVSAVARSPSSAEVAKVSSFVAIVPMVDCSTVNDATGICVAVMSTMKGSKEGHADG